MKQLNGFEARLIENPRDRITIAIYADWLHEHTGMSHYSALRAAARFARSERNAAALADATKIMRKDGPIRRGVLEALGMGVALDGLLRPTVVILPGRKHPFIASVDPASIVGLFGSITYIVGANWIIRTALSLTFTIRPHPDDDDQPDTAA